jgi:hypothetical protein
VGERAKKLVRTHEFGVTEASSGPGSVKLTRFQGSPIRGGASQLGALGRSPKCTHVRWRSARAEVRWYGYACTIRICMLLSRSVRATDTPDVYASPLAQRRNLSFCTNMQNNDDPVSIAVSPFHCGCVCPMLGFISRRRSRAGTVPLPGGGPCNLIGGPHVCHISTANGCNNRPSYNRPKGRGWEKAMRSVKSVTGQE